MPFDGDSYDPKQDYYRLRTQLDRVRWLLLNPKGRRWTLPELKDAVGLGAMEASISARIRDLRKEKFGSYDVRHERVNGGLWEYWIEDKPDFWLEG